MSRLIDPHPYGVVSLENWTSPDTDFCQMSQTINHFARLPSGIPLMTERMIQTTYFIALEALFWFLLYFIATNNTI